MVQPLPSRQDWLPDFKKRAADQLTALSRHLQVVHKPCDLVEPLGSLIERLKERLQEREAEPAVPPERVLILGVHIKRFGQSAGIVLVIGQEHQQVSQQLLPVPKQGEEEPPFTVSRGAF
jgi:hypothetical protein